MTVQTSLARLCLAWKHYMHLPTEPEIINAVKPKWPLWKNSWSFSSLCSQNQEWQTACCSHTTLLPIRNSSNLAGLQASCRRLHVEMIPSRQDYGRPFRSGEYDTHARIQFGYLTQQTLLQGTGEIALKHQQQESWPVSGGKYGSRTKRPKCHRWHHQWGIYTIKYYLQKKIRNITIRRSKVSRSIPSLGQLQPSWAAWPSGFSWSYTVTLSWLFVAVLTLLTSTVVSYKRWSPLSVEVHFSAG